MTNSEDADIIARRHRGDSYQHGVHRYRRHRPRGQASRRRFQMTGTAPLPLAPPPYRAEALHSWLRRVAAPYRMTPEELLHAVGVDPYSGPPYSRPRVSIQRSEEHTSEL